MPLSDHEQRLLEQMEQALYAEDPKFATTLRSGRPRAGNRVTLVIGLVVTLGGLLLLLAGVTSSSVPVGVLGFVAMLVGVFLGWTSLHAPAKSAASATPKKRRGGLNNKLESRWAKRREDGTF
ncbi:MAG: DUF3040 domain-containing protein [Actinomycetes bacterium]